jgi:histidyl-tRNA synthetase
MFPPELGTTISQVLVTVFDEAQLSASLQVANELRRAGLNTELYFDNDTLGDQIRYALKKGIPYVVIAGPDELAAGQVSIRNLPLNEQRTVERGVMAESIKDWGASGEK